MEPILLSWSGGKDSAFALDALRRSGQYDILALLTTVTEGYDRISMHGVRRELLHRQARSAGLALEEVWITRQATNEEYESQLLALLTRYKARGVRRVAFGDLFLEDIRRYREKNLSKVDMEGLFPLWGLPTGELARDFVARGFAARLVCVDTAQLDGAFAGRSFDGAFLADLPASVDPCGEKGEFHTFVSDGPVFAEPVTYKTGEKVLRGPFAYCDLLPE